MQAAARGSEATGESKPQPRPPEDEASVPSPACHLQQERAADAGQSLMENLNVVPQPPQRDRLAPEDITFQPSSATHPWRLGCVFLGSSL